MEKRKVTIHRNAIETFLMFLKDFAYKHRKPVIVGTICAIAAVILFVGGAVFYDISTKNDLRAYEELMTEYETGAKDDVSFNKTVKGIITITDKSYFGYVHTNGYYVAAGLYFEHKMFEEAKKNYILFADRSSSSPFAVLSLFQAGICAENQEKYDEAFTIYRKIEKEYKDSSFNDRLFYDLGRMLSKKGEKAAARENYKKVMSQYPSSSYAMQARIRLFLLGI